MVCTVTLPPIIMEVGNGYLEDLFPLQQRHFHFHIYGRVRVSKWETGSIWDIGKCQCHMNMSLKVGRYLDRYDSRHGQAFKRLRQQGRDIPRETSIPSDRGTFRSGKVFHGASLDRGGCEYIFEYLQTSVLKMLELRWNWQKHFKETAQYMIMSHFSIWLHSCMLAASNLKILSTLEWLVPGALWNRYPGDWGGIRASKTHMWHLMWLVGSDVRLVTVKGKDSTNLCTRMVVVEKSLYPFGFSTIML